jgi:hypothetical protein
MLRIINLTPAMVTYIDNGSRFPSMSVNPATD